MKDFSSFKKRIMPRVPGAAEPTVNDAIREAAIEFCRRTRMWREEDTFQVDDDSELIAVPYGAVLHEIESARFNGYPLEPVTLSWLEDNVPQWRTQSGGGKWITQLRPDTVRVVPTGPGTLDLSLFLVPAPDTDQLPDFLADHYVRCIADGALADLLAMPYDYANPGLASYHAERFERRLSELFNQNLRGQQRASVRVRPQFM